MNNKTKYQVDVEEIEKSLRKVIVDESQVVEIRARDVTIDEDSRPFVVSGYFTDLRKMAEAAASITPYAWGVYFTPNPVLPDLLSRAKNQTFRCPKQTTTDNEITGYNWFLVDCDPIRPTDTSSTDAQLAEAFDFARKIKNELGEEDWPMPIIAQSGNGAHLMYRVDLPVEDNQLLKSALEALALRYDNEKVKVDLKVFNPARIWRLYGTWAKKGEDTTERPHRRSRILWDETPDRIEMISREQLEELAKVISSIVRISTVKSSGRRFNIEKWIEDHNLDVYGPKAWGNKGRKWVFNQCPWNPEHNNRSAYIVELENGAIGAKCHHNGCSNQNWHSLRDLFEPGWRSNRIEAGNFHLTDFGNAERMVANHGEDLHFCHLSNKWYVWDGKRWKIEDTGEVTRYAKQTVRRIYNEASDLQDDGKRREMVSWAKISEGEFRIKAMIQLAQTELPIPIVPVQLDSDPWLLNVMNGTLNLKTAELLPHKRDHLITKFAPVEWKGLDERLELWEHFLEETTEGNQELKKFLQISAGYSLTGDTSEEVLFLVHGETNAGKSTFIEALKMVTGDYVSTADFETFVKSNKIGGVRNDIARLAGARLVVSIEVDEGKALAEGLIKSLTGGDSVAARFLYQEAFEFKPSFKLWLVANHAPKVAAHDGAMWRRILRLPFEHIVPEDRRNTSLKARLHDPVYAGPAILAWAVMGCLEWQRNGLKVPDCVKEATQEYRDEMDPLRDFISDCCEIDVNDPVAWESTWDIMRRYSDWAASNGIRYTLGKEKVSERLRQLGCKPLLKKINGLVSRGWSFIKIDKKVTPYAPF